jgi:hypothetical protein
MVGYFDDLSRAIEEATADHHVLEEIATRHSLEVVGSVPEGYL